MQQFAWNLTTVLFCHVSDFWPSKWVKFKAENLLFLRLEIEIVSYQRKIWILETCLWSILIKICPLCTKNYKICMGSFSRAGSRRPILGCNINRAFRSLCNGVFAFLAFFDTFFAASIKCQSEYATTFFQRNTNGSWLMLCNVHTWIWPLF